MVSGRRVPVGVVVGVGVMQVAAGVTTGGAEGFHFGHGHHRQVAAEQQKQREEQAEAAALGHVESPD